MAIFCYKLSSLGSNAALIEMVIHGVFLLSRTEERIGEVDAQYALRMRRVQDEHLDVKMIYLIHIIELIVRCLTAIILRRVKVREQKGLKHIRKRREKTNEN